MSTFLDLVKRRTSCRAYKPDPVPPGLVDKLLEAALLAPSACNQQPWRFAVVTDQANRRRLANEGLLPGLQMDWVSVAPVLLVMGIKKSIITHQIAPAISGVNYPLLDLGIAGEHAVLQATESGLGTCWIGWIKPAAIRRIVGWPRDITPQALLTIGWPANPAERTTSRFTREELVKEC